MKQRFAIGVCERCGKSSRGTGEDDAEATMFLLHNHLSHMFVGSIEHGDVPEKPAPLEMREELTQAVIPGGKRRKR